MGSQVSGVSSDEKVLSKTGQTAADFNFHCTPIQKYLMLDTNSYLVGFKVTKVSRVGLVAGQIRSPIRMDDTAGPQTTLIRHLKKIKSK